MNRFKIFILSAIAMCSLTTKNSFASNGNHILLSALYSYGAPKVEWKKDVHDFGEIEQGKPVSVEFTFTNNGNEVFLISDVIPSCGCTAPVFPKEPIAPGRSAKIKVTYNAVNRGIFSKTITVKSNESGADKILTIKGTVK